LASLRRILPPALPLLIEKIHKLRLNKLKLNRLSTSRLQWASRRGNGVILLPLSLFVFAATFQLGLPGLHYDEAKEAGVNAMEMLTGAPITAFRDAEITLFGHSLPLMVQDYIGAANVYLALPVLKISGIGVPNLRFLSIGTALLAMICLALAISEWMCVKELHSIRPHAAPHGLRGLQRPQHKLHMASLVTLMLLALSPSFVFWSRQGIYVTNLMQPLCFFCIWQGLRWLNRENTIAALLCAFSAGLAIYVKIQAAWIVGPFGLLLIGWMLLNRQCTVYLNLRVVISGGIAFLVPLLPLLLFDIQTNGLVDVLSTNASQSYYGINNADLVGNLAIRWSQLIQVLRGDQFWYLGGSFANRFAPVIAVVIIVVALWCDYRRILAPLLLFLLAFACSLFTISDLFINHYALLHPLLIALAGISLSIFLRVNWTLRDVSAAIALLSIALWVGADLFATVRYHAALEESGGLADHSDASYHLSYYLRNNGLGAPITLDWGIDAPVRYLTEGAVRPIEIFGYDSLAETDNNYAERLRLFIDNPDNVYLLHAPGQTIFEGRREEFYQEAEANGLTSVLEQVFVQRNQVPIYELWRVK